MKVLVVDDSPTMQNIITSTLKSAGMDVVSAEHGLDGLEKLKTVTPDLIITDLNMYHMDGFEFVNSVRQQAAHEFTPILFLTTEDSEDMKMVGKELGATGWVQKPFEPAELIKVINSVVQYA